MPNPPFTGPSFTPRVLAHRVRMLGPQYIVLNDRVYELLSTINGGNTEYVAFSPHETGLHLVQPFDGQVALLDSYTWGDRRAYGLSRIRPRAVVQCVAEQPFADLPVAAEIFAQAIVITGMYTATMRAKLKEMAYTYALADAASFVENIDSSVTAEQTVAIDTLARTILALATAVRTRADEQLSEL